MVPVTAPNICSNSATPGLVLPLSLVNVTDQRPEKSALSVSGSSMKRHVSPRRAFSGIVCLCPPARTSVTSPSSSSPEIVAVNAFS